MTVSIKPKLDGQQFSPVTKGGIQKQLALTGRLPPVSLFISPIDGGRSPVSIDRFLSYGFSSSILIPVDTFEFTYTAPDDSRPVNSYIKEGDLVTLYANDIAISTGIIDVVDIITDPSFGERVTVTGRDLLSQFEDQDAVGVDDKPIWANQVSLSGILDRLIKNTRIQKYELKRVSNKPYLFATEPGETKLSALQRHLEFLNALSWVSGTGRLIIGKPNFAQKRSGDLVCSKTSPAKNNTLSMRAMFASTSIPNRVIPIWTGQEFVQDKVAEQALKNRASGPSRLLKAGHILTKSVTVSTAMGNSPQDLAEVNKLQAAASAPGPGNSNILQAYGKRELAKYNHKELIVECEVPGHYNENGEPYQVDQVYYVEYERADIAKEMYLFQVQYSLNDDIGQRTRLYLCNKGTIVADAATR